MRRSRIGLVSFLFLVSVCILEMGSLALKSFGFSSSTSDGFEIVENSGEVNSTGSKKSREKQESQN